MAYDVAALRQREFPITERWAYLSHCSISPLPARAVRAIHEYTQNSALHGLSAEVAWTPCIARTRTKLAQLLKVAADEIAFVKNTSEGLSIVAHAIPWQAGDVILVAQGEFPANVYPWRALERHGVELRILPVPAERLTPEIFAAVLAQEKVKLVAVSWVQFHTGWRADLAAIGALCREAGTLLCVDAIQGVGGLELDLSHGLVDFCAFGGNKWMLSLQGVGGLYLNRRLRDALVPANVGWLGVAWQDYEVFDLGSALMPEAAQYEEGTRPNICIAALDQALDLIHELGPAAIEAQIKHLTDVLVDGLRARGAVLRSHRDANHWSGVVAWNEPQHDQRALVQRLEQQGVMITVREGSLRAAPHCYNNEQDIQRLLELLPARA